MKLLRALLRRLTASSLFLLIVGLFILVVFWNRIVIVVPAGSAGVKWDLLFGGTRLSYGPLREGLHLIFPWDHVVTYDARLQAHQQEYDVVTRDGLQVKIGVSFRWRIDPAYVAELHHDIGPGYLHSLLVPIIGSVTREVIANYVAADLVGEQRGNIQQNVYAQIVSRKNANGVGSETDAEAGDMILLRDVLIKSLVLPEHLRSAIEKKLEQAQVVEEFRFRLEREKLESQRKAVEAEGIESLNRVLSENYLKWRGIEATSDLAKSANSKVIVIGGGSSGLPVILNADGQATAANATNAAATQQSGSVKGR